MEHQIPQRRHFFDDLCGLAAVTAAVLVLYATSVWGPAISNDSFFYLVSAQNLVAGNGLSAPRMYETVPMTAWPPLYPCTLAAAAFAGIEIREAARMLGALLAAVNVLLGANLIRRATGRPLLALCGAAILAFSPTLLRAHSHVWSEPMSFFLMLTAFSFLVRYLEKPSLRAAFLFGIAAGLACLTRYAAIALPVAGLACMLLFAPIPVRRRLIHTALTSVLIAAPFVAWLIRNSLLAGSATNRGISIRIPSLTNIQSLAGDVSLWLLPKAVPPTVRTIILALAVAALLYMVVVFLRHGGLRTSPTNAIMLVFIVSYEAFIVTLSLILDPFFLADERIQLPVFIAIVIFVLSLASSASIGKAAKVIPLCAAVLAILYAGRAIVWAKTSHSEGQAYSSAHQSTSSLVKSVRAFPQDSQIFSNCPQIIYTQTGRIAWFLPCHTGFIGLPNANFADDAARFMQAMQVPNSFVVMFNQIGRAHPMTTVQDVSEIMGDHMRVAPLDDGCIITSR